MANGRWERASRCGAWAALALAVVAAAVASASEHAPVSTSGDEPLLDIVRRVELVSSAGGGGSAIVRSLVYADGSSDEDLRVDVEGLPPLARLELVVDGIIVAAFATDADGRGTVAVLGEEAMPGDAPGCSLSPVNRIAVVAVRGSDGSMVLSGDLRAAQLHMCAPPDEPRPCD
jgi:hypothetical protein